MSERDRERERRAVKSRYCLRVSFLRETGLQNVRFNGKMRQTPVLGTDSGLSPPNREGKSVTWGGGDPPMTELGKGQEKVLSGLQVDTLWPCSWVPGHRVSLAE